MISDNRLDDLGAIACDLLESVLRLIPEELIQGSRVQFHGIVKIGGVDRHVLERERKKKIKTNIYLSGFKEKGFKRKRSRSSTFSYFLSNSGMTKLNGSLLLYSLTFLVNSS